MAYVDYATNTWGCDACGKRQQAVQSPISPYDPVIPDSAITIRHNGHEQSFCSWHCAHRETTQATARPSRKRPDSKPTVVCLCGSTRFWQQFQRSSLGETMAGRIVLSIGAATGTDDEHFGNLPAQEYDRIKAMLDSLHLRKIDMADEVLILNCGDYIGESTTRELRYARYQGKRVRWLEESRHALPGETIEP